MQVKIGLLGLREVAGVLCRTPNAEHRMTLKFGDES